MGNLTPFHPAWGKVFSWFSFLAGLAKMVMGVKEAPLNFETSGYKSPPLHLHVP